MCDFEKKTVDEKEEEIVEWKNEVLHEILEEFSRGKEIETQKFVEFLLEYNNRPEYVCHADKMDGGEEDPNREAMKRGKKSKKDTEEEKKQLMEEQIEEIKRKLSRKKNMTLLECMEYILEEVEVDQNEREMIKAFEIFDRYRHSEIVTGTVPISDIKYIMEQMGPLGYQLNEYEQAKFWRLLKNDLEYVTSMQSKDADVPTVEIIEYINGNRHVNLVKDKEIDYAAFTKKLLASVIMKENQFKEMREKEEEQRSTYITIPS